MAMNKLFSTAYSLAETLNGRLRGGLKDDVTVYFYEDGDEHRVKFFTKKTLPGVNARISFPRAGSVILRFVKDESREAMLKAILDRIRKKAPK